MGHHFAATFALSEDGLSCTVTLVCANDPGHTLTDDAEIATDEETGDVTAAYRHGLQTFDEVFEAGSGDSGDSGDQGDTGDTGDQGDSGDEDDSGGNVILFAGIGGVVAILAVAGVFFFMRKG